MEGIITFFFWSFDFVYTEGWDPMVWGRGGWLVCWEVESDAAFERLSIWQDIYKFNCLYTGIKFPWSSLTANVVSRVCSSDLAESSFGNLHVGVWKNTWEWYTCGKKHIQDFSDNVIAGYYIVHSKSGIAFFFLSGVFI